MTIAAALLLGPSLDVRALRGAFVIVAGIASLALLIPVLGVRRHIGAAKRAELAGVAAAIAGHAGALAKARIAARSRTLRT